MRGPKLLIKLGAKGDDYGSGSHDGGEVALDATKQLIEELGAKSPDPEEVYRLLCEIVGKDAD